MVGAIAGVVRGVLTGQRPTALSPSKKGGRIYSLANEIIK
jgi:hypothetical protein